MEKFNDIYILGDIHGDFEFLNKCAGDLEENSILVQVGDFGLGFNEPKEEEWLNTINKTLAKTKSKIYAIRGNHDKKTGNFPSQKGAIYFLEDYTYKVINGEKWLFVGGATSIDRHMRREGFDYWSDETVEYNPDKCSEKCDVLVMHSAPISCYPQDTKSSLKKVVSLYVPKIIEWQNKMVEDLLIERQKLERVFVKTQPRRAFWGHFHSSKKEIINNCECQLLNINEIVKIK